MEGARGSMSRYFTVDEANALIPELEKVLSQLRTLKKEIDEKGYKLREAKMLAHRQGADPGHDAFWQAEAELEFLLIVAQSQVNRITEMGAQLKDIDRGLVDFLSMMEGREVLLCWEMGESEIKYWHSIYEGYAGRKPMKKTKRKRSPAPEGGDAPPPEKNQEN